MMYRSSSTTPHAIVDPKNETKLPLLLSGVISYLETRKPTDEELEECEHIELTLPMPWEPTTKALRMLRPALQTWSSIRTRKTHRR
jgi:hypothetical protein